MPIKRVLCPARVRRIPKQFSWVDQRLVRDERIGACGAEALALYLFLITVADAKGLSYYSDPSIARHLSFDVSQLARARARLQQADLIAFEKPLYQVLSLDGPVAAVPVRPAKPSGHAAAGGTVSRRAGTPVAIRDLLRRALGGRDDQL